MVGWVSPLRGSTHLPYSLRLAPKTNRRAFSGPRSSTSSGVSAITCPGRRSATLARCSERPWTPRPDFSTSGKKSGFIGRTATRLTSIRKALVWPYSTARAAVISISPFALGRSPLGRDVVYTATRAYPLSRCRNRRRQRALCLSAEGAAGASRVGKFVETKSPRSMGGASPSLIAEPPQTASRTFAWSLQSPHPTRRLPAPSRNHRYPRGRKPPDRRWGPASSTSLG